MQEIFFTHIQKQENTIDPIFKYKNTTIFLSNYVESQNYDTLNDNNIGYIVNATRKYKNIFINSNQNIKYLKVPIRDDEIYILKLNRLLPEIFKFFESAVEDDKNILFHCKRGHRRSATIVAILMVKYNNFTKQQAIDCIKNIRPNSFKPATTINKILDWI